jgi:hypothetical protein
MPARRFARERLLTLIEPSHFFSLGVSDGDFGQIQATGEAGPVRTNLASYHPNMYTHNINALNALQPEKEIGKYDKFLREQIQQVIRQR